MELVLAILGGAAGGNILSSMSSKFSTKIWVSLAAGMAGGGVLLLLVTKFVTSGSAKIAAAPDLVSLLGLLSIGLVGGALALMMINFKHWGSVN